MLFCGSKDIRRVIIKNKFFKISFDEFYHATKNGYSIDEIRQIYDNIKLPRQATVKSAGQDFFTPISFSLRPNETIVIPTGVRCRLAPMRFLAVLPRSGLGFKYRFQLDNTLGVIDGDYFDAINEGHIFIKATNDSKEGKVVSVNAGGACAQGIILTYEIADGAEADSANIRTGGFGSTSEVVEFGNADGGS